MREIIFVTGNKGKQASAQKYFDDVKINCYDYDYEEPDVNDIEYIAKNKVMQAYEKINKPCISLDAGFYIENYPNNPGFPGAFPKRELLDKIGIEGLIENMKDVKDRKAYFKECLAYYDGIDIKYFYGICSGKISEEIKGNDTDKKWSDLWYIFIPDNESKTLAEMNDYERLNRKDNNICAIEEFCKWYKDNN